MPRILIVDDNSYNLLPLKYYLKEIKFDPEIINKIAEKSQSNANSKFSVNSN